METLKIYFIEYDKNGNEIRRGVHPVREYKTYGRAWRTADKLYGDRSRFEVYIDTREPWGDYEYGRVCDICKKSYVCKEDSRGLVGETSVELVDLRDRVSFRTYRQQRESEAHYRNSFSHIHTCPECYEKVKGFIESITVKEENHD